jgi:NAD(P)H-quinone oxidoreductase subunit 5
MLHRLVWPAWLGFLLLLLAAFALHPETHAAAGLRLDALFWLLAPFIAFVGANVIRFAARYMDGEPRPGRFTLRLVLLLVASLGLLAADHVAWFGFFWAATAFGLAGLIGHYREARAARAARRVAGIWLGGGTLLLVAGLSWLALAAGTLSLEGIAARAAPDTVPLGALLLVAGAAVAQCALLPASRWLLSSMTVPTPVSALMHAGIVNAGGILLLRVAAPLAEHPLAMHAVFALGALSALTGSLIALIQSDIKRQLAASTVAQMGFMVAQCGLGLFAAAMAHLMLHGLYKAHLFLSAGSAVRWQAPARPVRFAPPLWGPALLSTAAATMAFALISGKRIDDAGLVLMIFAACAAGRAAWALGTAPTLDERARGPAMLLIVIPAGAVYGLLVLAVERALAPLGLGAFVQPLHPVHAVMVALFAAFGLWDLSGRMRRSPRLYAWLSAISRPAGATVAPHRSLHHA